MNVARDEIDDFLVFIRDDVNANFGTHLSHEVGHDDAVEPRSQEAYNDQSDIVDEECRAANGASRNADRCTEVDVHVFVDNFCQNVQPARWGIDAEEDGLGGTQDEHKAKEVKPWIGDDLPCSGNRCGEERFLHREEPGEQIYEGAQNEGCIDRLCSKLIANE